MSGGDKDNKVAVPAGLPTTLKDGDIILFGSDSQLRVHLMPAAGDGTTVEQHLRAECKQWTERIRVRNALPRWHHSYAYVYCAGRMPLAQP